MTPRKVFLVMIAALLIVLGAGAGVFYLVDGQLQTKADDVNSLKAELEILDLKIQNSRSAAEELDKFRDVEAIINDVLPPEKIQNDIVAEILAIASDNQTSVESISFPSSGDAQNFASSQTEPVAGVPGVLAVAIQLDLTADFASTLSLLEDFEGNQRKMQVVSVSMSPQADDEGNLTGLFTLRLEIRAYQRA